MSEKFYSENFNTKLSAENERRFMNWVAKNTPIVKRDLIRDLSTYDLRGWWIENKGSMLSDPEAHLTDRFKKPNHPTFSNESIYHGAIDPRTGQKLMGGRWEENNGNWVFIPAPHQLLGQSQLGLGAKAVQTFFKEQQPPDTTLKFPSLVDFLSGKF